MAATEEQTPQSTRKVLDYAGPSIGRRLQAKHVAAIVFAAFALLLGGLSAVNALRLYRRSIMAETEHDQRVSREDAAQGLACSIVLIVPGIWYAHFGIRGEPNGGDRPGSVDASS
jgi:hypothetical protein